MLLYIINCVTKWYNIKFSNNYFIFDSVLSKQRRLTGHGQNHTVVKGKQRPNEYYHVFKLE